MATKTKQRADWRGVLRRRGACIDAVAWASEFKGSARSAWLACERGDWLLWIAARLGVDRKLVVTAACDCAETAVAKVPAGEDRPRRAIETARRWVRGEATLEEVRAASDAAYAACDAAAAAYDAAAAAYDAAYAASDAAYAASDAAAYAARTESLRKCAGLVRRAIPWPAVRERLRIGSD